MFKRIRQLGHLHPLVFAAGGTALMGVSALLISMHVHTISQVRDVSVPIVAALPQLEHRLHALQEQVELTELQSATRAGSPQEKVEVYALPKETNVSRLVATFEVIRDVLSRDGSLADMSEINVSEPEDGGDGSQVRHVSVEFAVHEHGLKSILLVVRLAGLLTVGDLLTEQELALLVDRVEQDNPAGIVALEQFLSVDVLRYAEDPKTYEEQLKRSFSTSTFLNAFENVVRTSMLYDAKILLGSDLGQVLQGYKLWPMQIMALDEVSVTPGNAPKWYKLGVTVSVFSEES